MHRFPYPKSIPHLLGCKRGNMLFHSEALSRIKTCRGSYKLQRTIPILFLPWAAVSIQRFLHRIISNFLGMSGCWGIFPILQQRVWCGIAGIFYSRRFTRGSGSRRWKRWSQERQTLLYQIFPSCTRSSVGLFRISIRRDMIIVWRILQPRRKNMIAYWNVFHGNVQRRNCWIFCSVWLGSES